MPLISNSYFEPNTTMPTRKPKRKRAAPKRPSVPTRSTPSRNAKQQMDTAPTPSVEPANKKLNDEENKEEPSPDEASDSDDDNDDEESVHKSVRPTSPVARRNPEKESSEDKESGSTTSYEEDDVFMPQRKRHSERAKTTGDTPSPTDPLQTKLKALERANAQLQRQVKSVTQVGATNLFQETQVRKMVKEDLFKNVKFITTPALEKKCMDYLARKFAVNESEMKDWISTYKHVVRHTMNNKQNNVVQLFRDQINGKTKHGRCGEMLYQISCR